MLDLARLDAACPGLRELRVCGAVVQYRPPANTVDTRSFSSLHSLALEEVGGSGDGACWKRTVKRCLSLHCLTLHNIRLENCKTTYYFLFYPIVQCIRKKSGMKLSQIYVLCKLFTPGRMTDADVSDILAVNPLRGLQELNISSSGPVINLTEDSVFRLLERCPHLQRLGGICGWSARDLVAMLERLSSTHHFKIKMDERD